MNNIYVNTINLYQNTRLPIKVNHNQAIEYTVVNCEIVSSKVIDTIEGTSLDGSCYTGKKIIVSGEVYSKCLINASMYGNCHRSIDIDLPFSSYIVVPRDILLNSPFEIQSRIVDVSYRLVTNQQLFTSIFMTISYEEEGHDADCKSR